METTIEDILHNEKLTTDLEIIAGEKGIKNVVDAITIMEVEDFNKFDLSNFFILTTFSFFKEDMEKLKSILKGLIDKGITALAIKPGRFIKEIPQPVIDIANEYEIPLVLVNSTARFHNIISEVSLLINENHLIETQNLNKRYEELYNAFIEGKNINFFVDKLSELIGKFVICTDDKFDVLSSSNSIFLKDFTKKLDQLDLTALPDSHFYYYKDIDMFIFPCIGYKGIVGYIIIDSVQEFNEFEMVSVKQLATFITMRLSDTNIVDNFKRRERRNLIRNILLYDSMSNEDIILRLQSLNYYISTNYQLLYFSIESTYNHSLILQIISERLDSFLSEDEYLLERLEQGFLLIVNIKDRTSSKSEFYPTILKNIFDNLTIKPDYVIGYSTIKNHDTHFSVVFSSIINSIKFSKILFPSETLVCTEKFTDYKILFSARNTSVYSDILNKHVDPLRKLDNKKDKVYWTTLKETIYCQTIQEAAEKLFIHKTTVKYRLDKIKEYINLDFYDPTEKIKLIHVFMVYTIENIMK